MTALSASTIAGVFPPVTTTFDADGGLDRAAFAANLRAFAAAGCHGAVTAGSTGESPLLSETDRARLVETARETLPDDRRVIAGTGAESTWLTIERSRDAARAGAELALVLPPFYYTASMTPAALEAHYRRVADASPLPVLLYNMPKYTHLTLDVDLVHRLAEHGNVVGMKDSGGDPDRLSRYLEAQGDTFSVLTGHGPTFHEALRRGARGGILAVALFAVELTMAVYEAGGGEGGAEAQERLTPLAKEIVGGMGPAGIKVAMELVGLAGGPVRAPLLDLGPAERERVAALVRASGVLAGV